MTRKGLALVAVAAACATGAAGTGAAQAIKSKPPHYEHKASLKSWKHTQVCVNPREGFEPTSEGSLNMAPLSTSTETGEGFPIGTESCGTYLPNAYVLGKPGKPAGPWSGTLKGASWISFTPTGESGYNPQSPAYYIYEDDFTAECPEGFKSESSINVQMMADDEGGAFLNGQWLGTAEGNFDGPVDSFSGSGANYFRNGENKLQVVVYDTGGWTGTDFTAKAGWNCAHA